MFDVYCPGHGCRVILFSSDIEEIHNSEAGIEVRYVCFCGYRGAWRTGRRPHEESGETAISPERPRYRNAYQS